MALRVIGAGFGRTGTDSMRAALNLLGFGPCHHMVEVKTKPHQERLWTEIANGAPPNWDDLFDGYNSAIDWPSSFYWRTLMDVYPDARVILTWRSAESWWDSYVKTIMLDIRRSAPGSIPRALVDDQVFGGAFEDRDTCIAAYEANIEAVKATVPADRLLLYKVGDGWEPLCRHLGVAVPAEPFPHANTAKDFVERLGL